MFLSCSMMWTFVSTSCGRHFTRELGHWRGTGKMFKYPVQCLVQQGIRVHAPLYVGFRKNLALFST